MKIKDLVTALAIGSITGGVALVVLGLPPSVANGAAAGVTAALVVYARRAGS